MAKEYRIPVVVCVETYKFGERVVLDGIANNELSVAEDVFKLQQVGCEIKEELREGITSLPLLYDLTPPQCITAVCTEVSYFLLARQELTSRLGSFLPVPYLPFSVKDMVSRPALVQLISST